MASIRLGSAALLAALLWAVVNWLATAACLVFAVAAVGMPVPGHETLLPSAGMGAGTFSRTPGGLGVVDVTMIVALAPQASQALAGSRRPSSERALAAVSIVGSPRDRPE